MKRSTVEHYDTTAPIAFGLDKFARARAARRGPRQSRVSRAGSLATPPSTRNWRPHAIVMGHNRQVTPVPGEVGPSARRLAAMPAGDLFTLAAALADLIGAPVTIEAEDTTVLAYSEGQLSVDAARTATILGRRVPPEYQEALRRAGVYRRIARGDDIVYVDLVEAGMKPRAVIGIRAGDDLLGSIWAATTGPPTPEQQRALHEAVPVFAQYLLRDRTHRDLASRTNAEQATALLRGGADGEAIAAELGLSDAALTVAAVAPNASPSVVRIDRVAGALSLHLAASASASIATVLDGVLYVVLKAGADTAQVLMSDFLSRSPQRGQLIAGVGRGVDDPAVLHRSKSDAQSIVRALADRGVAGIATSIKEAFVDVLTVRVADAISADGLDAYGPLPALERYDVEHGSDLVQTARAFLTYSGDVRRAATALNVHPNTLRNRVRKAMTCGVDLDDADTRLALMLQLRAAPHTSVSHSSAPMADRTVSTGQPWPRGH